MQRSNHPLDLRSALSPVAPPAAARSQRIEKRFRDCSHEPVVVLHETDFIHLAYLFRPPFRGILQGAITLSTFSERTPISPL